jgi:Asp-tRNA(Asn)/Glu-tRNA(Gln) amidotransferase A subunit family amidase
MGAAMSLSDCAWAQGEQTRIFRRFQQLYERYDLIVSPTTPVSPFPWSELYLKEVNGVALENYYRWLALTYVVTLATNPSISLPCGRDHRGMPFGLQVTGPSGAMRACWAVRRRWSRPSTATPRCAGRVPISPN